MRVNGKSWFADPVLLLSMLLLNALIASANASEPETGFSYSVYTGQSEFVQKAQSVSIRNEAGQVIGVVSQPRYEWGHQSITFSASARFDRYMDVEFRLGFMSTDDDTRQFASGPITLEREPNYTFGAYGRFTNPEWQVFRPYLVAGFTQERANINSESGFSTGGGMQVHLFDAYWISAEYMRYFRNHLFESSGVTVGFHMYYD